MAGSSVTGATNIRSVSFSSQNLPTRPGTGRSLPELSHKGEGRVLVPVSRRHLRKGNPLSGACATPAALPAPLTAALGRHPGPARGHSAQASWSGQQGQACAYWVPTDSLQTGHVTPWSRAGEGQWTTSGSRGLLSHCGRSTGALAASLEQDSPGSARRGLVGAAALLPGKTTRRGQESESVATGKTGLRLGPPSLVPRARARDAAPTASSRPLLPGAPQTGPVQN